MADWTVLPHLETYRQACEAFQKGGLEVAHSIFEALLRALANCPPQAAVLKVNLALCLSRMGLPDQAVDLLLQVITARGCARAQAFSLLFEMTLRIHSAPLSCLHEALLTLTHFPVDQELVFFFACREYINSNHESALRIFRDLAQTCGNCRAKFNYKTALHLFRVGLVSPSPAKNPSSHSFSTTGLEFHKHVRRVESREQVRKVETREQARKIDSRESWSLEGRQSAYSRHGLLSRHSQASLFQSTAGHRPRFQPLQPV
jgi:hypothetical protein